MKIINNSDKTVIAANCVLADTLLKRLKGLMGRESFAEDDGLLIRPCNSIHTFFMRFSIDVIFLDSKNMVVGLCPGIKPFKLSKLYFKACSALELPEGVISKCGVSCGHYLEID
jgi:uncharacterized protein